MNYSDLPGIVFFLWIFIRIICSFIRNNFDFFWPGRQEQIGVRIKATHNAVKTQLVPFIAELGFKENRKALAIGAKLPQFDNTFSRQRGEFFDEIHFRWDLYGGRTFAIEFWTDQTERMIIPGAKPPFVSKARGEFYAKICPRLAHDWEAEDIWYGQGETLSQTMITAKNRLLDLDEYLRTGATTAPLSLVPMVCMGKDRPVELFSPALPTNLSSLLKRFRRWFWLRVF
jgi:hypothetical protein